MDTPATPGRMGETLWERRRMGGEACSPAPLSFASPARQHRSSGKTPKRDMQGDRFIPSRSAMDLNVALFSLKHDLAKENSNQDNMVSISSPLKEDYKRKLAENFLQPGTPGQSKILAFRNRPSPPTPGHESQLRDLYASSATSAQPRRTFRQVAQCSERILDAPELVDDYYLNLLDWSSHNQVAVALGTTVYLWEADTGTIQLLMQTDAADDYVTSVSWAADGRHLAVGLNSCEVQLWDVNRLRQVRRMAGHRARVGSLAWNGPVLSSGGRDSVILNHDVRMREHVVSRLTAHEQEVCGLRWSRSGQQLASGGNDNRLFIWDAAMTSSFSSPGGGSPAGSPPGGSRWLHRLEAHTAAVKALAWCPFQSNLLASGGGTADRCIRFWNTHTGACLSSVDTHSQVCSLQWSTHERELLSSHGYSQNQLCLWKYPSMTKMAELTGHTARVLHLAQSPDGNTVVSAAADETLRFWKVFGSPEKNQKSAKGKGVEQPGLALKRMNIR